MYLHFLQLTEENLAEQVVVVSTALSFTQNDTSRQTETVLNGTVTYFEAVAKIIRNSSNNEALSSMVMVL